MSRLSIDHQELEGVTGKDELNGRSSRSSSLSSETVEGGEERVQNSESASTEQTGGDTDVKSNETFDTLTSSNIPHSSEVCRPELDHQDVAVVQTRDERDNNQSTIHNNDDRTIEQQQQEQTEPSSNSRRFSADEHEKQKEEDRKNTSQYNYQQRQLPSPFQLPLNHLKQELQQPTNYYCDNLRLRQDEKREEKEDGESIEGEREKEVKKLKEDLKRLRIHLIQVEDGYTKELVESSEREEQLVSKLNAAEERIKWQEERLKESSDALKAAGRLVTSIDDKEVSIKRLRDELARKTEEIMSLLKRIQELEESCENKLDKQLIKSMLINYFTSPPDLKKDVARLLVRILDFSEQELIKSGLMTNAPSVQEGAAQVASQFVQFLERESVPRSSPQVPTVMPPSPSLSKTPSSSSLASTSSARSSTSTIRGSFIGQSISDSAVASGSINMMTNNQMPSVASTSSGSYRPSAPEAVRQLAKGLLHSVSNPFTNP